ncbi:DUF6643 family protein [Streptomyces sp. WMMB 322]|uniref:DUF6643 family protein n=1 Tax=Streptomyces sp. WMMB 322 TaxID=1286821 RepID=UPI0006E1558B|nr:DUF6643 family protein [Streptomyces sp. WMMB 322]
MTSPRYSPGGYYAGPSYPDTPIYDMLVNERGTPQIAPIRVPSAYEALPSLAALPPALPALPAGPSHQQHTPPQGYPGAMGHQPPQHGMAQPAPLQSAPLQQAPAPHIPQQQPQRGHQDPRQHPQQYQQPQPPQQMRPVAPPRPAAPRPAAPRPAAPRQMPNAYEDPYGGQQYPGRGY